jgi:hypothetical protein
MENKIHRNLKLEDTPVEGILNYIHSNVWGPSPTILYGGSSYLFTFIDDFSRKVWIYMLKRKADVFIVFK